MDNGPIVVAGGQAPVPSSAQAFTEQGAVDLSALAAQQQQQQQQLMAANLMKGPAVAGQPAFYSAAMTAAHPAYAAAAQQLGWNGLMFYPHVFSNIFPGYPPNVSVLGGDAAAVGASIAGDAKIGTPAGGPSAGGQQGGSEAETSKPALADAGSGNVSQPLPSPRLDAASMAVPVPDSAGASQAGHGAAALAALAAAQVHAAGVATPSADFWHQQRSSQVQSSGSDLQGMPSGPQDERELKRQRRKQSNRESARRSRLRKQAECEGLSGRVEGLAMENASLKEQVLQLQAQVDMLTAQLAAAKDKTNQPTDAPQAESAEAKTVENAPAAS